MADEKKKEQAATDETPVKKGLPIKMLVIIAGVMIVEAVGVVLFVSMGAGPSSAEGAQQIVDDTSELTTEIMVVEDKFANMRSGRLWNWTVRVDVKVKNKNAQHVKSLLERQSSEIQEQVSQIIAKADHNQLKDPTRQTVSRQIEAYLQQVFGHDHEGEPRIERIIVPEFRGTPAGY